MFKIQRKFMTIQKKFVWIKVYEIIVYIFGLEVVFIFKIMSFKTDILQYLFILYDKSMNAYYAWYRIKSNENFF
jgi:hypothetical protein